jgi:uncharacterized protein (DUF2147 family)
MKRFIVAGLLVLLTFGTTFAQSPVGEWLVKDGTAHIRIVPCGDALWGVISWTKGPPGKDDNNPDPAKRDRSVMGMPILLNMKPAGNQWNGEVYNAENGETYTSHISLASPDVLQIEGCGLFGLVCGGEDWKRIQPAKGGPTAQAVCSGVGK